MCAFSQNANVNKASVRAAADALGVEPGFNTVHKASCDNSKHSQQFIAFRPGPYIIKCVKEARNSMVYDVRSRKVVEVPLCKMAYGGWLCDDFSTYNNQWSSMKTAIDDQKGKSAQSFDELMQFLESNSVIIFVGENVASLVAALVWPGLGSGQMGGV